MTDSGTVEPDSPETQRDVYSMVVRLVAGGIGEGIDRLLQASAVLDEMDTEPDAGPMMVNANPELMAAVGWVAELPHLASAAAESAQRFAYPVARTVSVAANTVAYAAEATGLAPFIAGLTEPTRTAIEEERQRLTKVGTAEYARGRVLAVYSFEESIAAIVDLVSESPELADLVREQTIGITGSAVNEVRETGAAADSLTEGVIRRIFRRPVQSLPPQVLEEG